jgi:hypothetical protein
MIPGIRTVWQDSRVFAALGINPIPDHDMIAGRFMQIHADFPVSVEQCQLNAVHHATLSDATKNPRITFALSSMDASREVRGPVCTMTTLWPSKVRAGR